MHPAIDDYVRELRGDRAGSVAGHLEQEIPEDADALAVRWIGGRGVLALWPARLYTLHEHPHDDHPPTLTVTHLGRLGGAVVEETRRSVPRAGGFETAGVALRHPALPDGRVEADGLVTRPSEAALILRALLD